MSLRVAPIRTLDLFCGGGGSSLGAAAAGAEIVCGVDADELAVKTYKANFPYAQAVQLRMDESTSSLNLPNLGKIDLILASPECTNHTCAKGGAPRDEESRNTARYVLNFARELRPRWVIVENVVHMAKWDGYKALLSNLSDLGYQLREERLEATDFGVPQSRRRLFILCDLHKEPSPVRPGPRARDITARSVVTWDGPWKEGPLYNGRRAKATLDRAERAIAALGRGVPFLVVYYGSDMAGGWQPLGRPLRTLTTLDRFGLVTWLDGTPYYRMLQPEELQRAMGSVSMLFPDCTRRQKVRLLGNGVCPPVMETVVKTLCHESLE